MITLFLTFQRHRPQPLQGRAGVNHDALRMVGMKVHAQSLGTLDYKVEHHETLEAGDDELQAPTMPMRRRLSEGAQPYPRHARSVRSPDPTKDTENSTGCCPDLHYSGRTWMVFTI